MADDNKPIKYARYAIGEIVLVVIGILIALYINNWNERRQSERQLDLLLVSLKEDLELDLKYLDSLDNTYDQWYMKSEYVVDTILAGNVIKPTNVAQYSVGKGSMNYLAINRSTYNELLNDDKLYVITNQELKKSINDYFQHAEIELMKLNSDNTMFIEVTADKMSIEALNRWFRLNEQRNLEYIDWSWLEDPESIEYKQLENRILYTRIALKTNQNVIAILINRSKKLIDKLQIELDRN